MEYQRANQDNKKHKEHSMAKERHLRFAQVNT